MFSTFREIDGYHPAGEWICQRMQLYSVIKYLRDKDLLNDELC